jgi:O-antigen/teichoic acid export membrane protein
MSNIRKALGFSLVSKYLNQAVTMLSIVFVARMLTPAELGIFSIASAIALIIAEFKSFGVGAYLIRSDHLDESLVARALGLNGLISWSAGLAVFFGAWAIESFYQKPDIAILLQILSISFFLNPHAGTARSLMERNFMFDRLLIVDTVTNLVRFGLTIGLIFADLSYFALAIATSTGYVCEILLLMYFKPPFFVFMPHFRQLSGLAKFGVFVTVAQFFRTLNNNVPELIIGKLGSAAQVAYFSRALGLLSFLNMTITSGIRPVIIPYLASKKREGQNPGTAYLHASQLITCIVSPIIAVFSYASTSVIIFMFGDQWQASTSILSILACAYGLRIVHTLSPQLLVTSGLEKHLLVKDSCILLLTIGLATLAYPYGLDMVAWSVVCSATTNIIVLTIMLHIFLDIPVLAQLKNQVPNILLTGVVLCATYLLDHFVMQLNASQPFLEVLVLGMYCAVVWFTTIFVIRHPLRLEISGLANNLMKRFNR